jgi:glycosyltransferase involved in cell wall biosynthesis
MNDTQLTKDQPNDGYPFVSVIMPVRNEAAFIERSLGALLRQTYPSDSMEIIVADGMSTDSTREIIGKMSASSCIPITVVDNPRGIAPTGLNCALAKARGEIIVRVDGHCEVAQDYVEKCVTLLQRGQADGVGGPIETIGESLQARAIATAMSSKFGVGGSAFRTIDDREMSTDTVAFPGYTREIIDRVGRFNEELVRNQDDEYNYRIRKSGGKILLSPQIRSRYYSRSTFKSLWRQYYQYGFWKVRVMQLHPAQMSIRQFVPFTFVLTLLALAIISIVLPIGFWALTAVLAIYLFTNIVTSVSLGIRDVRTIPFLVLSFTILHFSYGLGFMVGLVSFLGHWKRPAVAAPGFPNG